MSAYYDEMTVHFSAKSENEGFARLCAAAFTMRLDPSVNDLEDVKTAVSEAVTNAIIHGYKEAGEGKTVTMKCALKDRDLTIIVTDAGCGIESVEQAREPLYTSKPELERSGMGFTIMETFMDSVTVESVSGQGTVVIMTKTFA